MSRSIRGTSAVLVAACCLLMFLGLITHRAVAKPLPAGDFVIVFLPTADGYISPLDQLVFTGQAATSVELPECFIGTSPVQEAVVVDSNPYDGANGSRTVTVVVSSHTDPVPAGTRVNNISGGGLCASGGVYYRKYTGFTE